MAVEVTPKGTRGAKIPKLPRPVMKVFMGLFRLVTQVKGMPLLELTTRGARSGQLRTVTLRWLPDGPDTWLVIASIGGAAQHPGWYFNMAKNPDAVWITLKGRKVRVIPESLKGAERAAVWQRIVKEAPGYAAYQEQTDREIPVIRLRAAKG